MGLGMPNDQFYHLALPAPVVEWLRNRFTFDSEAGIAGFVRDAIEAYADLGALAACPGDLMSHPADGSAPRRVRLAGGG